MAHATALAAARHHVLEAAGWDVERDGLAGAPPIRVLAGAKRHTTVDRALRFIGLGTGSIVEVPADDQGRMRADGLREALRGDGPAIVCAQAGEAWMSGTTWAGRAAIRLSVSNWSTSDEDVERTVAEFARAAAS